MHRRNTVLIYRLGSLGDTVVALPCFHAVARAFPDHRRLVITNVPVSTKAAPLAEILEPSGLIHGVIAYPVALRSLAALRDLRRSIKEAGAETLVYMAAARGLGTVWRDLLFFRACGIKTILCAPIRRDLQDNRALPEGAQEPEVERLVRTFQHFGSIDLNDKSNWDLRLTDRERNVAIQALAFPKMNFVAINLGGKAAQKDWGTPNWGGLLTALSSEAASLGIVAVGAQDDVERSAAVLEAWPGSSMNLCGQLSARECAAVLGMAAVFVGHDSGPLHLAAAGGTLTVGLFGDYNRPRKWHPYGVGHLALHEMRGVRAILVDQVEGAVRAQLAEVAKSGGLV